MAVLPIGRVIGNCVVVSKSLASGGGRRCKGFARLGVLASLGYGNSTGAGMSRVPQLDETSGLNVAKDAVVRGSGASRPWMACARLLEPGTAESGDAHDPRTAAAPPEAGGLRRFSS